MGFKTEQDSDAKEIEADIRRSDNTQQATDTVVEERTIALESKTSIKKDIQLGYAGLSNIGNTCYMNSVLQCLCNTAPLIEHFKEKTVKGNLGEEFQKLLRNQWVSPDPAFTPLAIKKAVSAKYLQFDGCLQHDAQEFLISFLGELHEELNKCNSTSHSDDTSGSDTVSEQYKRTDDSVVSSLFHGRFQSLVKCLICSKVSVTHDPFITLPLSLPSPREKFCVQLFLRENPSSPKNVFVEIFAETKGRDIRASLTEVSGLNPGALRILHSRKGCILRLMTDDDVIMNLVNIVEDNLAAYEVLNEKNEETLEICVIQRLLFPSEMFTTACHFCGKAAGSVPLLRCKCFRVAYCNSACQKKSLESHRAKCIMSPEVFAKPFLFSLRTNDISYEELYTTVASYAAYSVDTIQTSTTEVPHPKFFIKPVTFEGRGIPGSPRISPENLDFKDATCLAVDWRNNPESANYVIVSEKIADRNLLGNDEGLDKENLTLEQCLSDFVQPEKLDGKESWFCPECKRHCPVTKRLELESLPEILIVQLKRFAYSSTKEKIRRKVDFPLRALDLGPYTCHKKTQDRTLYDLYAVVNHYGSMTSGHYTAFARCPRLTGSLDNYAGWREMNDSQVTDISEAEVVTEAAYLLFYQRRT